MDLRKTAAELIKFRTETGNLPEIDRCMRYLSGLADEMGAAVEIYKKDALAPVMLLTTAKSAISMFSRSGISTWCRPPTICLFPMRKTAKCSAAAPLT